MSSGQSGRCSPFFSCPLSSFPLSGFCCLLQRLLSIRLPTSYNKIYYYLLYLLAMNTNRTPTSTCHLPPISFSLSSSPTCIHVKNKHKEHCAIVVATKTQAPPPEEELLHQWSIFKKRTLMQIHLSDEIDLKFQKTKKAHKHIWVTIGDSCRLHTSPVKVPESDVRRDNTIRRDKGKSPRSGLTGLLCTSGSFTTSWKLHSAVANKLPPPTSSAPEATPVRQRPNTISACDGTDPLPSNSGSSGDQCSATSATSSTFLVFPNRRKRVSAMYWLTSDSKSWWTSSRRWTSSTSGSMTSIRPPLPPRSIFIISRLIFLRPTLRSTNVIKICKQLNYFYSTLCFR